MNQANAHPLLPGEGDHERRAYPYNNQMNELEPIKGHSERTIGRRPLIHSCVTNQMMRHSWKFPNIMSEMCNIFLPKFRRWWWGRQLRLCLRLISTVWGFPTVIWFIRDSCCNCQEEQWSGKFLPKITCTTIKDTKE